MHGIGLWLGNRHAHYHSVVLGIHAAAVLILLSRLNHIPFNLMHAQGTRCSCAHGEHQAYCQILWKCCTHAQLTLIASLRSGTMPPDATNVQSDCLT